MLNRLPWISLALLLLSYASVGRFLATSRFPWIAWAIAISWILLVASFLISPLNSTRTVIYRWFKTDALAFLVLILAAGVLPLILVWWRVFLYIVVIVSAETLARLDIQTAKFGRFQAFWILLITSLLGLAVGWTVHWLV